MVIVVEGRMRNGRVWMEERERAASLLVICCGYLRSKDASSSISQMMAKLRSELKNERALLAGYT